MTRWIAIALLPAGFPAWALDLVPPGATEQVRVESPADSVRLPRAAWKDGVLTDSTEGAVKRTAYSFPNPSLTTLQLLESLRSRLVEAGYAEVFTCADAACGGFDFRFQLDLLPAPAMHVDLGNFRYLLMENKAEEPHTVSLLASASSSEGYLHVTEVAQAPTVSRTEIDTAPVVTPESDLISTLVDAGHVVLADLEFATGSADLGAGPFASLEVLADWLRETPGARIVLVGHSDSVGSLELNTLLSRRRAISVQERLTGSLGTNPAQVQADGAGALFAGST